MDFERLINTAKAVINPRELSRSVFAGSVGAAILTDKGNVYTGVCIDAPSALGCCAENAAIAAMVTAGENRIIKIVALNSNGEFLPPCGRCRELINQIHDENYKCEVMLKDKVVLLEDLLPHRWN